VKINFLISVLLISLLLSVAQLAKADDGKAIFFLKIDENWKPIDPGTEFDTNQVSCLFTSPNKEQFNALEAIVTIYSNSSNSEETKQVLLARETMPINPEWNALIISDVPLPDIGSYSFVMSSKEGKTISAGDVTIKEKNVDKKMPEKQSFKGVNLESLFNKYKDLIK
jgi:hypothetical protein